MLCRGSSGRRWGLSGLNDMSMGRAVGSERRCGCVLMSNLVFGYMYPACVSAGERIIAKSSAIDLCVHFLLPLLQQNAWSPKMSWSRCPHVHHVCGG
jgi:hypothetical protein